MSRSKAFALMMASPARNPAARLPDEYVGETSLIKLKYSRTIDADPQGNLAFAIRPQLDEFQYAAASTDNGDKTITWGNPEAHPDYDSFKDESVRMRFLAAEAEFSYIGAEQTSAGRLSLLRSEASTPATWEVKQDAHFNDLESHVLSVHSIKSQTLSAILTPYDRPSFVGNVSTDHATYFPSLTIVGAGLPAAGGTATTPVLQMTVSVCIEFVTKPQSLLRHHQRAAPVAPMQIAETHRILASQQEMGVGVAVKRENTVKPKKRPRPKTAPKRRPTKRSRVTSKKTKSTR